MEYRYLGVYYKFLDRVVREPRFLANIRHPEAGWKVSRYELRYYTGIGNARLVDFAIACRLRGFAVERAGKDAIIIRRDPLGALLQLVDTDDSGRRVLRIEFAREFERNTGLDAVGLLRSAGYSVSTDGRYYIIAGGEPPTN